MNKTKWTIIAVIALAIVAAGCWYGWQSGIDKNVEEELAALEKAEADKKQGSADFIAAKSKENGVKPLGDGVYYKVLAAGDSTQVSPKANQDIEVTYEMRLPNGKSVDKRDEPMKMNVGNLIEGVRTALTQMHAGDEWVIYIPYDKGYGERGAGSDIPPYSALEFQVKLCKVL